MKIAIVHNDYGKFSGEEAVVRDQVELLTSHGHEVLQFRRSSAELHGLSGRIKGLLSGIWNPFSRKRFATFLAEQKPDIVHIHNLYPLIGPGILPLCAKRKIPVVMTVHNFRLVCPNGLFFQHGAVCEKCAERRNPFCCFRYNCLESFSKSFGYALRTAVCRYFDFYGRVTLFLCLTEFQKKKLNSYGIPAEKCVVIPNFVSTDWLAAAAAGPATPDGGYVAYMGRLSREKGIDLLLAAAEQLPHIPFRVAGNGAEEWRAAAPGNVEFVGYLTGAEQIRFMAAARLQVMASRCYENFPTTLLQGMAMGVPAVVPELGGMPDIVGDAGWTFKAHDAAALAACLAARWEDRPALDRLRQRARERCAKLYSPERVYGELISAYRRAGVNS